MNFNQQKINNVSDSSQINFKGNVCNICLITKPVPVAGRITCRWVNKLIARRSIGVGLGIGFDATAVRYRSG